MSEKDSRKEITKLISETKPERHFLTKAEHEQIAKEAHKKADKPTNKR